MDVKQVIVVRRDLKMGKGKIGAQVAHASMGALLRIMRIEKYSDHKLRALELNYNNPVNYWLDNSFTKICLACNSEEELLAIHKKVEEARIPYCLITDNGATVFKGVPTNTCCAVGPWHSDVIDNITGGLKLL